MHSLQGFIHLFRVQISAARQYIQLSIVICRSVLNNEAKLGQELGVSSLASYKYF